MTFQISPTVRSVAACEDAGFWPAMRSPSTTTCDCQGGPAWTTATLATQTTPHRRSSATAVMEMSLVVTDPPSKINQLGIS